MDRRELHRKGYREQEKATGKRVKDKRLRHGKGRQDRGKGWTGGQAKGRDHILQEGRKKEKGHEIVE